MPYIKKEDREVFEMPLADISRCRIDSPGELNYLFTMLIHIYLKQHGHRYRHLNDVVGALQCAQLELYRRHAAPFEDKKASENGDVP